MFLFEFDKEDSQISSEAMTASQSARDKNRAQSSAWSEFQNNLKNISKSSDSRNLSQVGPETERRIRMHERMSQQQRKQPEKPVEHQNLPFEERIISKEELEKILKKYESPTPIDDEELERRIRKSLSPKVYQELQSKPGPSKKLNLEEIDQ